jgi:NhaP-type Na+/H+ or K+/H+ antiporter
VCLYASYGLGDFLGTSGVSSLLITGLIFSQYGYYNLSANGKFLTPVLFKNLAFLFQGIVFILLGLGFISYEILEDGTKIFEHGAYSMQFFWS